MTNEELTQILGLEGRQDCVREEASAYMKEGGMFSVEDYYALPQEFRVELIDGVIYDMASPGGSHQLMVMGISARIYEFVTRGNGNCKVFTAPFDVQLDCDDKTIVQPDILILCDMEKYTEKCILGAPDFVAEVSSESTRKKDSQIKLKKYREAGVKEYWIIDLKREKVIVYHFEKKEEPTVYGFDSMVPVGIYRGALAIDFQKITKDSYSK